MPAERSERDATRNVMTSDDDFAASARSDALLARVLGHTLETATMRLVILLALISAAAAAIARLA
jgi:hypothetical protein